MCESTRESVRSLCVSTCPSERASDSVQTVNVSCTLTSVEAKGAGCMVHCTHCAATAAVCSCCVQRKVLSVVKPGDKL